MIDPEETIRAALADGLVICEDENCLACKPNRETLAYFDRLVAERNATEAALQRIMDHYDMRTELYTNDLDVAAGMADIARLFLSKRTQG